MKSIKKIITLMLILTLACSCCTMVAFAKDNSAKVVFDVSDADADGNFKIDLTIYNATFKGFLGSFSYDGAVVAPMGDSFSEIASIPARAYDEDGSAIENWLLDTGSSLKDNKLNLVYLLNTKAKYPNSIVSSKFQALADENGLTVASFSFKKLTDGNPNFSVETQEGAELVPFRLVNANGVVPCEIHINIPESMGESLVFNVDGTVKTVSSSESEADEETMKKRVQARSNGTLFLQIDNYATVSDSLLKWIDKDNKSVMPYIKDNRTMVPLRYIAEELNSKVSYNEETREITIENARTILVFKVGSVEYTDDGLKKSADVAPEIVNDRTFVPLRVISEALNRSVEWLADDKIVVITSKEYPWSIDNKIENELLTEIKLMISPMIRDYAYLGN